MATYEALAELFPDLANCALNFGALPAVSEVGGASASFDEFARLVVALSGQLRRRLDPAAGDRVGVCGHTSLVQLAAFYALPLAGAVVVPLNYRASAEELRGILDDAGVSAVICDDACAELVDAAADGLQLRRLRFDELAAGPAAAPSTAGTTGHAGAAPAGAEELGRAATEPAYIFYTGGTTGRPKGVVQSVANYRALAIGLVDSLSPLGLSAFDSYLQVTPPYHGGCWALCHSFLSRGLEVRLLADFDPATVMAELNSGASSLCWMVPTMIYRLLEAAADTPLGGGDDPARPIIISAGGPLGAALRQRLDDALVTGHIVNMLGQTEMTSTIVTHAEPRLLARWPDAIGLPVRGCGVQIRRADGSAADPGEVGELCYRGPMMMQGYWHNPDATAQVVVNGEFRSGDVAHRGENGLIFLDGRVKEMIISGGVNLLPSEIERAVEEVEGVRAAVVIGVEDGEWGERAHAVLLLDPGAEPAAVVDRCRAHCRAALSHYKVPKSWSVRDELPTTAVGKIDRKALQRDLGTEVAPVAAEQLERAE